MGEAQVTTACSSCPVAWEASGTEVKNAHCVSWDCISVETCEVTNDTSYASPQCAGKDQSRTPRRRGGLHGSGPSKAWCFTVGTEPLQSMRPAGGEPGHRPGLCWATYRPRRARRAGPPPRRSPPRAPPAPRGDPPLRPRPPPPPPAASRVCGQPAMGTAGPHLPGAVPTARNSAQHPPLTVAAWASEPRWQRGHWLRSRGQPLMRQHHEYAE